MKNLPLRKETIIPRVDGIKKELKALEKIKSRSGRRMSATDFGLACWHLQHILEGMLNISAHILSRVPGAVPESTRYQDIAKNLSSIKVVPKEFADNVLVKMARYRNRLVHGYAKITPKEISQILKHHVGDIEKFLKYIKKLLTNPGKYGFTLK